MQEIILKLDILKKDYENTFKKSTLFFLPNPIPLNGQRYQKQKGPETSNQSLFRLRNKFRKILLWVTYYLTKFDDVIQCLWCKWCNKVIPKTASVNLCKPIYDIINYCTSIVLLYLEIVEKEKITKIWISREQKELFRWNKKHFS